MAQERCAGPLLVERLDEIAIGRVGPLAHVESPFRATVKKALAHYSAGRLNIGLGAQDLCKPSRVLVAERARGVVGVIQFADRDTLQSISATSLLEPADRYFPGHIRFLKHDLVH